MKMVMVSWESIHIDRFMGCVSMLVVFQLVSRCFCFTQRLLLVILSELLLELVQHDLVRIVSGHEHPAIGIKLQIGNAGENGECQRQRDDGAFDSVVDDSGGEAVHETVILRQVKSPWGFRVPLVCCICAKCQS